MIYAKHLLRLSFLLLTTWATAQTGPAQRTALLNLQKANIVESSRDGQIPLTNTDGNQRYAQYTEIDLVPIGYTPTATGNTANYSEFVTTATGDIYYIDWQGRGLLIGGGGAGSCDLDWLEIGDNSCPDAITDSIYHKKYASIGARLVWPDAEFLVNDSLSDGVVMVTGDRRARLVFYDNFDGSYGGIEHSGSNLNLIVDSTGSIQFQNAYNGSPALPGNRTTYGSINALDSTLQLNAFGSTRPADTQTLDNVAYFGPDGKFRKRPIGDLPPAVVAEPTRQLVFGTGSGIDSDTGALYLARKIYAPNFRLLPTRNDSTGILYSGIYKIMHFYGTNDSVVADNIFMGRGAGNFTMAPGSAKYMSKKNIGIGQGSLPALTTGYLNTVVGWESAKSCTTCAGTIAVGGHVLENLTTSHDNIGIGDNALRALITGPENTAVGYGSLLSITSGTHNVGFGFSAGISQLTGDDNTYLGSSANTSLTTGITNSTALGANSVVTKSNQVVLGGSFVTEVFAPGTIVASETGANIRVTGGGTSATDGAVLAGNTGNIWLSNYDVNRGIQIAATTGNITQLGSGTASFGRIGANATADATAALNVVGTSLFSGTINANSVGANIRIKATAGTAATDAFLGMGGGNNIRLSRWDQSNGLDILSNGNIEQIGNYALKVGSGAGVPTGSVGYIKHNTSTSTYQVVPTGTTWVDILMSTTGWKINGNAVGAANQWIGTIDNQSFKIRTNNTFAVKVDTMQQVGIGVENVTAALHIKAGLAAAGHGQLKFDSSAELTTKEKGVINYTGKHYSMTLNDSLRLTVPGVIWGDTDAAKSVGTSETTLYAKKIKGRTFNNSNGAMIHSVIVGNLADATSVNAQIKIYAFGTLIMDTGAQAVTAISSWKADVYMENTGTNIIQTCVVITAPGLTGQLFTTNTTLTGLSLGLPNDFIITATATGAGATNDDITAQWQKGVFYPTERP